MNLDTAVALAARSLAMLRPRLAARKDEKSRRAVEAMDELLARLADIGP